MRSDGLCACATCDSEYPPRVAFSLLTKILEDFDSQVPTWKSEKRNEAIGEMLHKKILSTIFFKSLYNLSVWPPLEAAVAKYQDPVNADQIMKIQKNLDETRDVLHQTIDSVLQRGEKLEDLVERSGELSAQSKLFYKQAKRANSCCAVI